LSSIAGKTRSVEPAGESTGLFASPGTRSVILCLLLVTATLVLYNPVIGHPFVNFDDDRYIVNNPHVQAGLSWHTIAWAFSSTEQANWHPLTWLSHALDCQLFHLNPAGHHYTNVLLHAVNAVFLFLLLQWTTGSTWRSMMVAALFALHPINVESVAWISERKNVLSMLFFLLALWSYGWYAGKPGVGRYLTVGLLFACGLMAKPMVITFPFVLLLWDYWPLRRMFPERGAISSASANQPPALPPAPQPLFWLVFEKLPLLTLSAGSALITMKAQREGGAVRSIMEYSFSVRLANAAVSYASYVGKAFWPWPLAPLYPHPGDSLPKWQIAAAALFLFVVTAWVVAARRQRYLAVGWFWFLGTLVPMIGLVQVGAAAMADRYAYLPYVGLFAMVCWGVAERAEKKHVRARGLAIPSFAALLALAVLTQRQLHYWSDNVTLWSHALQVTKQNFVAEDNLGGALIILGKFDEAMPHFEAAVQINPWDPVGNLNLATHEQQAGNLSQAVELYLKVVRMTPDDTLRANAFSNLGAAYRSLGDPKRAEASYAAALRLAPSNAHACIGLGLLALKAGDYSSAAGLFSRAIAVQPTDVGYLLLAQALRQGGRPSEAQVAYQQAQRISPDLSEAQKAADRMLGE
jgi:tetratricopeptide (TPR) repeat protein